MFYDFTITIPANTPEASPVSQELQLSAGILHYVEIEFPSGCQGLAHMQIKQPQASFLPTNPDGDFASDNYVIPIQEHFEIVSTVTRLMAVAWNEDDTYAHTISIRIGVLPTAAAQPSTTTNSILSKLLSALGVK